MYRFTAQNVKIEGWTENKDVITSISCSLYVHLS